MRVYAYIYVFNMYKHKLYLIIYIGNKFEIIFTMYIYIYFLII